MRRWTCLIFMLLAFLVATVAGVHAGHRSDSLMISPFAGGYLFDSDVDLEDEFTYGLGLGYNFSKNFAMEAAANYADTETENTAAGVDTFLYRLDGLYHFMPDNRLVPYIAAGAGAFKADPDTGDDVTEFSANFGGGLKYFLHNDIALRADVRDVMTFPENHLLYTAGLTFYIGGGAEEKVRKPVETKTPAMDSDNDGVIDDIDNCPDTPAGVEVDNRGCAADGDVDGVPDYKDECPNTPIGVEVDAKGCASDADNDGVIDEKDQCPDTPAGVEVDEKGCPVDTDGDGVADMDDKCPNTPAGANVNDRGCWEVKDLQFEVGAAAIRPAYQDNLKRIVKILEQNPDIEAEIQGHTDSQGAESMNRELSERRARAVRDFLVENGIDSDRLTYKGYGESKPVASNDTAEGRAKNRRVEIKPVF
ncbi:MAG: outer membrane beta-barrel domain-containing protein [Thermodesulfobacteriota bacterium]